MTSRRPYWCTKTMKWRPCWCSKPFPWELNSFFCKRFLLFQKICIHAGHVSENALYVTGKSFLLIFKQKHFDLTVFSVRRFQYYIFYTKSLILNSHKGYASPMAYKLPLITPFPRNVSLGELPMDTLPILELASAEMLYRLVATHLYVAWSEGWNSSITSSLITVSVVTFLVKLLLGMTMLSLYQTILERGNPFAEQLSRTLSLIPCTVMELCGFVVNTGGSGRRK